MALILAVNPGNRHNPTLARLARELQGCEIIGAESCSVAIKAIRKRVPDVLLLPETPARGQADLIAHLKSIPGGVLTLTLPPVESADPGDLARQIRELLTGVPAAPTTPAPMKAASAVPPALVPEDTSPHLIAAATAAIAWARTRRAQWSELAVNEHLEQTSAPYEPIETYEPIELSEPYEPSSEPAEIGEDVAGASTRSFLPRAGAVAVAIAVVAAAAVFWPHIRGAFTSSSAVPGGPNGSAQPAEAQAPVIPPAPAAPDPAANPSGYLAVKAPFEVSISEGGQAVPFDDKGRAVLPPGRHRLNLRNEERGYDAVRTVQVRPGETTTLTLTPDTTIAVTTSEPAEVLIDGTRAGNTPYEGRVSLGTHTVTVRTAGGERQLTVEATSKPVQLEVDFSKP